MICPICKNPILMNQSVDKIKKFNWMKIPPVDEIIVHKECKPEEDKIRPCGCDQDMECEDCNPSLRDPTKEDK